MSMQDSHAHMSCVLQTWLQQESIYNCVTILCDCAQLQYFVVTEYSSVLRCQLYDWWRHILFYELQLIIPVKIKYPCSWYETAWTNSSTKHFKLIILESSCCCLHSRSWDLFHQNQSIGARILSCIVATLWLPCNDSGKLWDTEVESSHLWGHLL